MLDNIKHTNTTQITGEFIIGAGGTEYKFPTYRAPGNNYTLIDTLGDGVLQWSQISSSTGNIGRYDFKRITDNGTNYLLLAADVAVEIVSDTYTSVTLPTSYGNGGKIYIISRASNTELVLYPQSGEKIDEHNNLNFPIKYSRVTVMSNNTGRYYII